MATFVQLGEEDPGYDLVLVLNNINDPKPAPAADGDEGDEEEDLEFKDAKESALGKLVTAGKYDEVINKGFLGSIDKILALEDADTIDTVFSLAFALLDKLQKEQVATFINDLAGRLSNEASKNTLTNLKLNLLCVMFNLLDAADPLRKDVFMVVLKFALSTGHGAAVVGQLRLVPAFVKTWGLGGTEEAELYLLISQLCEQAGQNIEAQSYLVRYLTAVSACGDAAAMTASRPHAARAAVAAVKSFSENPMEHPQYDCDRIRNIPAVLDLEKDKKYAPTYALLRVFACETVAEYLALVKKHPKLCAELEIDTDIALQKLRTLTICSLGMEKERLSFATLIDRLKVADTEAVESVIIDAVMAGRVDAKIDQEAEEVIIQRTTQRIFNTSDWKTIGGKLNGWKNNIHHVLSTLAHVHAQILQSASQDLEEPADQ